MSPTHKLAIDGRILARYFYKHEGYETGGVPHKTRRVINGYPVKADTDGRIIRRWSQGGIATHKGAVRLLEKFDLSLDGFALWCEAHKYKPTIRGSI